MDPPVSVPTVPIYNPPATAAAEPEDDPAGPNLVSQGLRAGGRGRSNDTPPTANSHVTTFPDHYRPMLVGYARVSTDDQALAHQRKALREAGCRKTYAEKVSGARRDRPELDRLLDQVREGDVVVVTRLDRLARSTRDLLEIAERLRDVDAGLRGLAEPWADTTSPDGRMVLPCSQASRSSNGR